MSRLEVTFVLPSLEPYPCGGFIIVYQYAVRLAQRGHRVRVVHLRLPMGVGQVIRTNPWWRLLSIAVQPRRVWRRLRKDWGHVPPPTRVQPSWFALPDTVESWSASIPHLAELSGGEEAAVVATSHETAECVHQLPPRRKFHFIQGWDAWEGNNEREVVLSWRRPLRKLVVSRWLRDWAVLLGDSSVTIVPNAIDDEFRLLNAQENRDDRSVLFYYGSGSRKDWATGQQVLERVLRLPDVRVSLLSAVKPPVLPDQVKTHVGLSRGELARLYSAHAIFVHTSFMEGWGLPPMEAMACGCACAMTDSMGVRDYLDRGHLERLRPPGDVDGLVMQIASWLEDPKARADAAREGQKAVASFTWERSTNLMEEALRP